MPTDDQIGVPEIQSRALQRGVSDPRGQAMEAVGRIISSSGQKIAAAIQQNQNETDSLDLARARADWNTRRLNLDDSYTLEKNPAYDKWGKSYDLEAGKNVSASAALISNAKLRERFILETQDDVTRGSLTVKDRAAGIDRDKRIQEGFDAIDKNLAAAARPGVSQEDVKKIIEQSRADIDNMVATGTIAPGDAIKVRKNYMQKFAALKAAQDIQDDPKQAATWLSSPIDGRKTPHGAGDAIRNFEGFRTKPYWDVNAYRIGYGSDTITRSDGTVVKVRPGMTVTREDAERDLERRIGEFQSGIVKDVGPDKWAAVPPDAKAALISVAYNYGSLPGTVVAAIQNGNMEQVAQAVENLDANPKRRAQEAAIIRGGGIQSAAPPDYYEFLAPEDRLRLSSAAEGRWAANDTAMRDQIAIARHDMQTQINNDLSQISATGQATNLNQDDVAAVMGVPAATQWLEKRQAAATGYASIAAMDTMSGDQIEQHLQAIKPEPGDTDFALHQKTYEKAVSHAQKLEKMRIDDPARSVESSPIVVSAMQGYQPDDPQSVQKLVKARLAAQQGVGISDAVSQPVTRKEAKEIVAPIERIIDMQEATIVAATGSIKDSAQRRLAVKEMQQKAEAQIREIVQNTEKLYGPYAPRVLAYAIAESVRDKEIGNLASTVLRKMANNEKPSRVEMQGLDAAKDASLAEKGMNGQLPSPENSIKQAVEQPVQPGPKIYPRAIGRVAPDYKPPVKHFGPFAPVTDSAVEKLMANPNLAPEFDKIFGPGEAARWLPKVPQE